MRSPATIKFTSEEMDALGYVLDLAHGDQESYLSIGNPRTDYGDEWPHIAAWKAREFRAIAAAIGPYFAGGKERWNSLADSFEASGKEYQEANA